MSINEKSKIWLPIVTFTNTNEKDTTVVDKKTYIQINKTGDYTYTPVTDTEEAYLYEGKRNPVIMKRYYREIFIC